MNAKPFAVAVAVSAIVCASIATGAQAKHENLVIDLWMQGKPVFGVYAPNENAPQRGGTAAGAPGGERAGAARGEAAAGERGERGEGGPRGQARRALYTKTGAEKLAANPLYDFVFLNLEGSYDADAIRTLVEGLRGAAAVSRKTLIVRIPPIERDGPDAARARVKEALDVGADGVTIPQVRSLDEARQAISFFESANANVWSPSNPKGEKLAMLMIEDPGALAQASAIADLKGYSILACGIGSLRQALGGDREGAEAGTQKVLAEAKRVRLPDMLTASPQDIETRVKEGFLALLTQGASADEAIRIGRAAAGR
jgi:2-keto-3-deoxy-L-rhamnonate aldolase RhmA